MGYTLPPLLPEVSAENEKLRDWLHEVYKTTRDLKATDSDLLQGQDSAYHLARTNHTGTQNLSTISDSGALAPLDTVGTTEIDDDAVTYPKMQDVTATDRLLGRDSAGAGVIEEIDPAAVRTMINVEDGATADQTAGEIEAIVSHDNLIDFVGNEHIDWTADQGATDIHSGNYTNTVYSHPNHSGDVTSSGDGAQTIAANAVSLAKMADMATDSFIGRDTAGTGDPEILSATTARSILNVENDSTADQTKTDIDALGINAAQVDGLEGAALRDGSTSQAYACSNLAFPISDVSSADPNTLDDYEEGDWTPILSDGTNNAPSSVAVGRYIKKGREVTLVGRLRTSSLGSVTGILKIIGIPFLTENIANGHVAISVGFAQAMAITAGYTVAGHLPTNVNFISLNIWDSTAGTTSLVSGEWSDDGGLIFSVTYYT